MKLLPRLDKLGYILRPLASILLIVTLIFIAVPVYLIRYFVLALAWLLQPDFGRMLSPCSSLFAVDRIYQKPSGTLIPTIWMDGKLDFEALKCRMEYLVTTKDCAELCQSLKWWMGFYFWKWNGNFSLDNHLTHIATPTTRGQLKEALKKLNIKPYQEHKPLWEVILYSNIVQHTDCRSDSSGRNPKSALILRIHHALADGYSILHLMDKMGESSDPSRVETLFSSLAKPDILKRTLWDNTMFWSRLIFSGPVELIQCFRHCMTPCSWRFTTEAPDSNYSEDWTDEIQFDDIVNSARTLEVSTTALLLSAYTGVVRRTMLEMKDLIPDKFVIVTILPVPGHPRHPTNDMILVPICVPLECTEPIGRLKEVKSRLESLRNSPVSKMFYWLTSLSGCISGWGISPPFQMAPAILNNFPGPRNPMHFLDVPLTNFNLLGGIPLALYTTVFSSHSYGGNLAVRIVQDNSVFQNVELPKKMLSCLLDEIEFYKNAAKKRFN